MTYYGSSKSSGSISEGSGSGSWSGGGSISEGSGSGSVGAGFSISDIVTNDLPEGGPSTLTFTVTNTTSSELTLSDIWDLAVTLTVDTPLPAVISPSSTLSVSLHAEAGQAFSGTTVSVFTDVGNIYFIVP